MQGACTLKVGASSFTAPAATRRAAATATQLVPARAASRAKAGDRYLRCLLVLGASTVIRHNRSKAGEGWLTSLIARRPTMVAAVAQANKAARIVWALLARGGSYHPQRSVARPAVA